LGFVNVDCVASCVCGNMHSAQSKARAGELYVDHPWYCLVAQVGSRCASARCLSFSCLTIIVTSHRYALTRPVEPWALPCGSSEGSWISWQRRYKHCRLRCVHWLWHSTLPPLPVASSNSSQFHSGAARPNVSSRGPKNAHDGKAKVCRPAPGTGNSLSG